MKVFFYFFSFLASIHFLQSEDIKINIMTAQTNIPIEGQGVLPYAAQFGEDFTLIFTGSRFTRADHITFEQQEFGINSKKRFRIVDTATDDNNFTLTNIGGSDLTNPAKYYVYLDADGSDTSNKYEFIYFDKPDIDTIVQFSNYYEVSGDYFIGVTNVTIDGQSVDNYQVSSSNYIQLFVGNIDSGSKVSITNSKGTGSSKFTNPQQPRVSIASTETPVKVRGLNLSNAKNVYFGSVSVPFQIVSDNLIIVQPPLISKIAQKLNITVENAEGISLVEPKPSFYLLQPFLSRKLNQYLENM